MGNHFLVNLGGIFTNFALKVNLPIRTVIKKTIFDQFCGGENVNDCELKIKLLAKYNVGTILDYSVEGVGLKDDFQSTVTEIKKTIDAADNSLDIPFSVFKLTGLTSFSILKAANDSLDDLNSSQLLSIMILLIELIKFAHMQ